MKLILEKYNPAIYILYAIMVLLPFGGTPVVYCIVALLLDFIIQQKWKNLHGFIDYKNPLVWMTLFYLMICLSLLWTQNSKSGRFELEQKLSLLIIPIIIYAHKEKLMLAMDKLMFAFVCSNLFISIFAIVLGINTKINHVLLIDNSSLLPVYSEFSPFLHVAYFGFYLCIALIISIYFVRYSSNKIIKIVSVISILFCAVALYFSSSKGSFLSLFFMLACMAVIEFINSKSKLKLGLIYATVLSLIVFSLKENPRIYSIKQMVVELIHPEKADPNASSDMSNGQRIYVIKSSIEVIKSNFWVGVGAGDVIDELEQKYITNNYQVLAKKKLNCHNQFLESFVEMGLLGGFIFLILNVVAIIQSIKNKNQLQLYFIIGFSIIALTESFLNHQAGVVFFALFLSIFSILNKNFLKVHEKNSNHNRS
ncbi:MAG: hypothetical protein RIQ33_41 [Bacteroidota bacterium]|jgi:hypothetical protein